MGWTYYWAKTYSEQPRYRQFNYNDCLVGCGPVAWGILFGWADRQAEEGNSYWSPRWGIYRENGGNGANVKAPLQMNEGVRNMISEINDHVDTWCVPFSNSAATYPWKMDRARKYLSGRTGTSLRTAYSRIGRSKSECRINARNSIRNRKTPVVIGTGWLKHYPVAYGYAWRSRVVRRGVGPFSWTKTVYDRWFRVNQGWGQNSGEWVEASTWFAGEIFP